MLPQYLLPVPPSTSPLWHLAAIYSLVAAPSNRLRALRNGQRKTLAADFGLPLSLNLEPFDTALWSCSKQPEGTAKICGLRQLAPGEAATTITASSGVEAQYYVPRTFHLSLSHTHKHKHKQLLYTAGHTRMVAVSTMFLTYNHAAPAPTAAPTPCSLPFPLPIHFHFLTHWATACGAFNGAHMTDLTLATRSAFS